MKPALARRWSLDPAVTFLNHGSFGAAPIDVLDAQRAWRDRMEAHPVRFLARDLEGLLGDVRAAIARFVCADPDDLALVQNATIGVNTVLRSVRFEPGDELLATDHGYNASLNALHAAAERDHCRVVLAHVPFPIAGEGEVVAALLSAVTRATRLVLVDHVTSATGLVFPIESIVAELAARGIDCLVDGAHGPGMVPLDLDGLGAAYYAGNCHKWLCAPKGSAFLHVRADRQASMRPLAISHGANDPRTDPSRFRLEFDWTGTLDPTSWLAVPTAIEVMGSLLSGGWPELMEANHRLALRARDTLCAVLGVDAPAPDSMIGAMASVPLGIGRWGAADAERRAAALSAALLDEHGIEVPIMPWPPPRIALAEADGDHRDIGGGRARAAVGPLVRVSAQLYNAPEEYAALAMALQALTKQAGAPG